MTSPATGTPHQPDTIPPAVVGLSFVSLWNDVASEMVYPLLPNFIVRTLGGGAAILGVLDGAAELTDHRDWFLTLPVFSENPWFRGMWIFPGGKTWTALLPVNKESP